MDAESEVDLSQSIKLLSKLLEKHYNRKVYLLIDEYDAPINSSLY